MLKQKTTNSNMDKNLTGIKICGITGIDAATAALQAGADALGFVFFKKSPRNIEPADAARICSEIPPHVAKTGVFVNPDPEFAAGIARKAGLTHIQLHGKESNETVEYLRSLGFYVIKALFADGEPGLGEAENYNADAFLVECSKGPLPGGNAAAWNWGAAASFARKFPCILAGGLTVENVCTAIRDALPDAVDVSSGVESAPGVKSITKIHEFITTVRECPYQKRRTRRIF